MSRQLVWTLVATFALAACGAGDRPPETKAPVATSPVQAAPTQPAPAPTAPVAVEEPVAAPPSTVQPTERLYTVQIAAYVTADSAQALAAKLSQRGLPVWTMEVRVGQRTYHRIRVGAHPRLADMRRLGREIATQYRQEVWVAPIDMAAQIPAGAVEATRALLQAS